jgi:hypothetical protein
MCEAIPLLPCMPSWHAQGQFLFIIIILKLFWLTFITLHSLLQIGHLEGWAGKIVQHMYLMLKAYLQVTEGTRHTNCSETSQQNASMLLILEERHSQTHLAPTHILTCVCQTGCYTCTKISKCIWDTRLQTSVHQLANRMEGRQCELWQSRSHSQHPCLLTTHYKRIHRDM